MRAVRKSVEANLLATLESLKPDCGSWRALWCRLSAVADESQAAAYRKIIFALITEKLAGKEGFIFFHADGDMLVLGNIIPRKIFSDIVAGVAAMTIAEDPRPDWAKLTTIFDLSIGWNALTAIADEKYRLLDATPMTSAKAETPATPTATAAKPLWFSRHHAESLVAQGKKQRDQRKIPCILLVEDDPLSLHLAKKTLADDFTVITAPDGTRACEAYVMHLPDVVFLDIGLPDMSGHHVLHNLLQLDPEACIVMLSGQSFRDEIMRAMSEGAKGFIGKPFTRAKLLHYIAALADYTPPPLAPLGMGRLV